MSPLTLDDVVKNLIEKWPNVVERAGYRVERARALVEQGAVIPTPQPLVFVVRSQSNARGKYTVDWEEKYCTCPDAGGGNICKHRLAAWMFHELRRAACLEEERQEQEDRERFRQWKEEHPQATNIDFKAFVKYPFLGTVRYLPPFVDAIELPVLATPAYMHAVIRAKMVDVIALKGKPFHEDFYQSRTNTVFASHFTPAV
jgi:hypothetical protein